MFTIIFKCQELGKSAFKVRDKVKMKMDHSIVGRTCLGSLSNYSKIRRVRRNETRKSRRKTSINMILTLMWRSSAGSAWKRSVDLTTSQSMLGISIVNFMMQKQEETHLLRRKVKQYLTTLSFESRTKRKWKMNHNLSRKWQQIYRN